MSHAHTSLKGDRVSHKAIGAVVFDRDGVLTNFDYAAVRAFLEPRLPIGLEELIGRWQRWGETIGWPGSVQAEGVFWQGFWDELCNDLAINGVVRAELQAFNYTSVVQPYPDARPAMLHARRCGLRIGVLSNFSLASLDESLVAAGLADLVDVACAATVIGAAKPDPRSYAAVLHGLGVAAEETIFFDDELPCVEGARAVGMHAYLIDRWGTEQELRPGVARDLAVLGSLLQAHAQGVDLG
jgi:putative hydrolase of the HAD superfamily